MNEQEAVLPEIEITIREVRIDDLPSVFHLGEEVFTSQDYSNLYRTWDEWEVTLCFNQDSEHFLVALEDDAVVGFAMGTTIEKRNSPWSYGHLLWLGVEPRVARSGVGSMLFDRFKKLMRNKGIRMLIVDTQADNDAAIDFFRKKGFDNPIDHVYFTMQL